MKAETLVERLLAHRIDFFTGVPCSYIKPLINQVIDSPHCMYVPATIEGEAIAIAAGAQLAGRRPVVMLQNSGLGNIVNPVTSLLAVYQIPALIIVTWRAAPLESDAAQHTLMGQITPDLLTLMGIRHSILSDDTSELDAILSEADRTMQQDRAPYAIIIKKGVIDRYELRSRLDYAREHRFDPGGGQLPPSDTTAAPERDSVMAALLPPLTGVPVVSTTGYTSRALYNAGDRDSHFYMQGSMGFAASIALGVSLFHEGPVAVIDGDGSLLMRMSVLATLGAFHRSNLIYILLDNCVHDSTGGQRTISSNVRFDRLAEATGFDAFREARDVEALAEIVRAAVLAPALTFAYARTAPGAGADMGRPGLTPAEIAVRFSGYLTESRLPATP